MYPPLGLITKESPKGGVTLCSYYVPEGTPMNVSYSFKLHLWVSGLCFIVVSITSFLRHWCAEILSTSVILTHLTHLDLMQRKHGTWEFTKIWSHALSLAPPTDQVHLSTSRSVWVIAHVLDVTLLWWVKGLFHGSQGAIPLLTWVKWACNGPLLSPDWSQSYPRTVPANLQADTASFIQAGGGTVWYHSTKGQCSLHSSGNWIDWDICK